MKCTFVGAFSINQPFAYSIMSDEAPQRDDFTSEVFKVEIRNISYYGFGEIKKFLKKKLDLNPVKIKAQPGLRDFAYCCFRNEEERTVALAKLDGYVWKGKTIKATIAAAVLDPMAQKRASNTRDDNARKSSRTVLQATAPLAHLPYAEQLRQKEADLLAVLRSYGDQAQRLNRDLPLRAAAAANDGLPCRWLGFKPSPQVEGGYRNKSEFTVGRNAAGEKVVGFRLSSYVDGSVEVDAVDALPHIPANMKHAALVWQTYVRQSQHDVFSPEFYRGVHRQLTVRVSMATAEIMLVIGIHSTPIADQLDALKADILAYFAEREGLDLKPASVYLEHMNKREPGQITNPVEHIYGSTHITDTIHGLRFRISPESFFQVNTQAAEVLYQAAIDMGAPTPSTTVMDICCGTGTIGLCFSKYCKQVVGVEIIPQAIEDAAHNASANGITNCAFYAGNCDDWIRKFAHDNSGDDLLAIIDPPRAGLHIKSIASLRSSKGLNRFVYISCSPKAALRNWVDLARASSKAYKGNPFVATAAIGVDMFPHTHHKEMVLLFERIVDPVVAETPVVDVAMTPVVDDAEPPVVDDVVRPVVDDAVTETAMAVEAVANDAVESEVTDADVTVETAQ